MLYDLAFFIFSIFYLPALIFRGKLHGDFLERFGAYEKAKADSLANAKDAIWIQAVSVGEVALCRNFVPLFKTKFPGKTIIFSTITKTGNDLAKKLFAKDAIIIYFPLDFSFIVKKVIGVIRPKLYVMVETEIWPNFIGALSGRKVPIVLINGRISDRSFGKYKSVKPFLKNVLGKIDSLCMQSGLDAQRITELGAPQERVKVTGNMKFDIEVKSGSINSEEVRMSIGLGPEDDLLVAGSTHPGEEEAVIDAYAELFKKFPRLKLLIAPRHVERSGDVAAIVKQCGFEPIVLSRSAVSHQPSTIRQVYILDTIGRLNDFYSIAAIVFIGGSLVKHGGQNPIEPGIYAKPVIFGPYMFNFKDIAALFLDKSAAIQVSGKTGLSAAIEGLLNDKEAASALGARAKSVVSENRGATEKNLGCVTSYIR